MGVSSPFFMVAETNWGWPSGGSPGAMIFPQIQIAVLKNQVLQKFSETFSSNNHELGESHPQWDTGIPSFF